MASYSAVAVAAFMQIIFRISFFIEPSNDLCSTAPSLASWIFLIAFLDILLDTCIYPVRYMHLPRICQIVAEIIVAVLLTEFGSQVMWCTLEKICCKLCESFLLLIGVTPRFYFAWESYILGTATTSTSLAILLFVGHATDHFPLMHKRSLPICRFINYKLKEYWTKLRSFVTITNKCPYNCLAEKSRENECVNMKTEIIYLVKRNRNTPTRMRTRSQSRASRGRSRR